LPIEAGLAVLGRVDAIEADSLRQPLYGKLIAVDDANDGGRREDQPPLPDSSPAPPRIRTSGKPALVYPGKRPARIV
jgi:hypothetical protein